MCIRDSSPYIGRLNLFRVMTGKLDASMSVYNEEKDTVEKVGHLYVIRGKEQIEVDELHSGDIGALADVYKRQSRCCGKNYHFRNAAAYVFCFGCCCYDSPESGSRKGGPGTKNTVVWHWICIGLWCAVLHILSVEPGKHHGDIFQRGRGGQRSGRSVSYTHLDVYKRQDQYHGRTGKTYPQR